MSGLTIASGLLNDFTEYRVKELIEKRPWMVGKKFLMLTGQAEIEKYIDVCIEKGLCALDTETTGLSTRVDRNKQPVIKLVGVCLAVHEDEGVYIPVGHEDKEFNVSLPFIIRELKRLCASCRCIFHNFKYDGEVLRNLGIIIEDDEKFEDTMLMAAVVDASRRDKGLKDLTEALLGREMIEMDELGVKDGKRKKVVAFDMIPPQKAVYYGASDAMCTYMLYKHFEAKLNEQDPTQKNGSWAVYRLIEKRCLPVTMEMERNLARIDIKYLEQLKEEVTKKMSKILLEAYEIAGREFDINSPQQLGPLLFEELKIPFSGEKTKTGQYSTDEETLEKLSGKYPIVDTILRYRGFGKVLKTYIENFLKNVDENGEVKFNLNQVRADTGRFSSSGGRGLFADGYSGVNCQNIPNHDPDDSDSIDMRKAIIAHDGYKIASIDYSGEELRVAANLSKEPKWIEEFVCGSADLHTKTAQAVTGKKEVTKVERKNAKTLNFHILYGGGAGGFAARAKIPYETAKKMLVNFFTEFSTLKKWIDKEIKISRKRGYSVTSFGRRRPLTEYYNNPDPKIQAKGDRCAVNAEIQGGSADLLKIALYRVSKWIRTNGLDQDVRILMPVHDELVFEIKEEKLDAIIPELCDIMKMKDITKKLGWPVPLDVDAEYGDTFSVDHNYWEEHKEKSKGEIQGGVEGPSAPTKPVEPQGALVEHTEVKETPAGVTGAQNASVEGPGSQQEKALEQDTGAALEKKEYQTPETVATSGQYVCPEVKNSMSFYRNEYPKSSFSIGPAEISYIKNELEKLESSKKFPLFQGAPAQDSPGPDGYFNYTLSIDSITAKKLKFIFDLLMSAGDETFVGPKNKICLLSKDGEVYYKSMRTISTDAFTALCLLLNI